MHFNGTVFIQQLERTAGLTTEQLLTISDICFRYKWSNRTQVKLIRIARAIADLQEVMILQMKLWKKPLNGNGCLRVYKQLEEMVLVRRKRNWQPNAYYHVVMRGNTRQNIFSAEEDMYHLMRCIAHAYEKYRFTLIALFH